MAQADVKFEDVGQKIPVGITLHLTMAEARALQAVVGNLGGPPADTIRQYTDSIFWAIARHCKDTSVGYEEAGLGRWPEVKPFAHDPFKT